MVQTTYLGLDLAWSTRNLTGAAALRGDSTGASLIEVPTLLRDLEAIVGFIQRHAGDGPAIVTVDAPLLVPNVAGRRPAEAQLSRDFRTFEAGAHPANRALLDRDGSGVRGELLVERLTTYGFRPADRINPGETGRLVTEVYPHAAMVALFGLRTTLKYKSRGRRSRDGRLAAWRAYQDYLRALESGDPPLFGHHGLLATEVATLRGASLKGYEDRVDALLCAYIALYAHRWGAQRCRTYGDLAHGWIYTPVPPAVRATSTR